MEFVAKERGRKISSMSQAAFSLLTAGIKFKGLKESEKQLFKKGSMRCVDSS